MGLLILPVVMRLRPTKSDEIRRTVGQRIVAAAAFQAAEFASALESGRTFGKGFPPCSHLEATGVCVNRAPAGMPAPGTIACPTRFLRGIPHAPRRATKCRRIFKESAGGKGIKEGIRLQTGRTNAADQLNAPARCSLYLMTRNLRFHAL